MQKVVFALLVACAEAIAAPAPPDCRSVPRACREDCEVTVEQALFTANAAPHERERREAISAHGQKLLDECIARARAQEEKAAAGPTAAELAFIEAEAESRRHVGAAWAEARARNDEAQRRLQEPALAVPFFSTLLCMEAARRAEAVGAIRDEQKYARELGGVVDLEKIYGLQDTVKSSDRRAAGYRGRLAAMKRKAMPCASAKIQAIWNCIADECTTPELAPFVAMFQTYIPEE